ncbi:unannotated protein [freshwater metagenome]|uniref:Unannotated protein n=1 Tax=freshwater metagenome TaxID=449393 RepID=A0A6J5ZXW4_9ZZZZ
MSLDRFLLGAEGLDLRAQLGFGIGQLLLLAFEFSDLRVERLELSLGDVLALQSFARQLFVPLGERLTGLRVEFDDRLFKLL